MDNENPQIQYSYRWGNSAPTPWVDAPAETEIEVHAGFFLRARIKPQRCAAVLMNVMEGHRVECERLVHDGPDQDPVHEGAVISPDGHPSGPVMRWTDAVKRVYPTWDGRDPEGH